MLLLKSVLLVLLVHLSSAWNYGGGGWYDHTPSKVIVKHVPKHVPVYKHVPIPKPIPVPKPVGYLKPLAIAKPFRVPHVVPVIKHFQKPFPVMKGVPFHFPIPLPKLVKLPFQIKLPKPYVVRVPKPYAVAKKYPVPVPVHIPKPYIVPVLKPVPVGVPHKIPSIVPVIKEVPEYVKKPVPVYIEEKPYKHEYGNYKGTPYMEEGSYKGTPFPFGLHKGTPFQSGSHKGTPFPSKGIPYASGLGEHKGTPYPESGGNKGSPYIPSGKGGEYHSKGTNVHAISAASFLETHSGKLSGAQNNGGHDNSLSSYSQGLGGSAHGNSQKHESSGYQLGNLHDYIGTYGSQAYGLSAGEYDLHGLPSVGGYDALGVYGRGAEEAGKLQDLRNKAPEHSSYESGNTVSEHDIRSNTEVKYEESNQGNHEGNDAPAYIGVSVTSYDDHSGRGGGYQENAGNYGNAGNYDNHGGDNKYQQQGYQSYGASNAEYSPQDNGPSYGHQVQPPNYVQLPQLALYQIQNGASNAIQYPHAGLQFYNAGYQVQNGHQNQGDSSYANNQLNEESQAYQHQGEHDSGSYQQQQHQSYAVEHTDEQRDLYQNSQTYGNHENDGYGSVNQEASSYGYPNQEGYGNQGEGYQKQESYENQDAYHNVASYQVSPNTVGYQNDASQEIASGLQNYGLRAAYAVQPGTENNGEEHGSTVYVRAYGSNQGGNQQASYGAQTQDNYQTQDSQQQKSYATFSSTKSSSPLVSSSTQQGDATVKLPVAATGRSYDSQTSEAIVGSSSGYSQPAGDAKGGSWHGV